MASGDPFTSTHQALPPWSSTRGRTKNRSGEWMGTGMGYDEELYAVPNDGIFPGHLSFYRSRGLGTTAAVHAATAPTCYFRLKSSRSVHMRTKFSTKLKCGELRHFMQGGEEETSESSELRLHVKRFYVHDDRITTTGASVNIENETAPSQKH